MRGSAWHHLRRLAALLLFILALFLGHRGLTQPVATPTPLPTPDLPATRMYTGAFWEAYFTRPDADVARSGYGGPDVPLARALDQAQDEILMAAYALDDRRVLNALREAAARGLTVQVVLEDRNASPRLTRTLREAGIPYVTDDREGYMHHKFVVLDRSEVWTGSMNFTFAGAYLHNNHLVRLFSTRLAQNYAREFEEMFRLRVFGRASSLTTPYPRFTVQGVAVESFFLPDDPALDRLLDLVRQAREEVVFLAFSFTSDPLAQALLERHRDGVRIRGLVEASQVGEGSEYARLEEAGIEIYLDANPYSMHHKALVVDGRIVAFGSYNFSYRAEHVNDENLLILHDPLLAAAFLDEFARLVAAATHP